MEPLLKRRTSEALLRALRQSALALGELNDLQVAQALYRSHAQAEPQAWFAGVYLAARLPGALEQAALSLARLRKQRLRWR